MSPYRIACNSVSDLSTICSICSLQAVRPRRFLPKACKHVFCHFCLNLAIECSLQGNYCPLCYPACKFTSIVSDEKIEQITTEAQGQCIFNAIGCIYHPERMSALYSHVHSCQLIPPRKIEETCKDCSKLIPSKIIHYCNAKLPPSGNTEVPKRNWMQEFASLSLKEDQSDVLKLTRDWKEASKNSKDIFLLKLEYITSLNETISSVRSSCGKDHARPHVELLDRFINLLADLICNGRAPKGAFHLELGNLLEERQTLQDYFPVTESNVIEDGNKAAHDEFLADEVKGLLLTLGIAPTSPEVLKLKAIEEEYQRLKGLGKISESAEVQDLYQWKLLSMKDHSKTSDPSKKAKGFLSYAMDQYLDAVSEDGSNYQSRLALARLYLRTGELRLAQQHLEIAAGISPLDYTWRQYLGLVFLSSLDPISEEILLRGVTYLEEFVSYFKRSQISPHECDQNELLFKRVGLYDGLVVKSYFSLARGYFLQSKPDLCESALMDIMYLVKSGLNSVSHRGSAFKDLLNTFLEGNLKLAECCPKSQVCKSIEMNIITICEIFEMHSSPSGKPGELLHTRLAACELLAFRYPTCSAYLCKLGEAQLDFFDMTQDTNALFEAEFAFLQAIASETKTCNIQAIKKRAWWVKRNNEISKILSESLPSKNTPQKPNTKSTALISKKLVSASLPTKKETATIAVDSLSKSKKSPTKAVAERKSKAAPTDKRSAPIVPVEIDKTSLPTSGSECSDTQKYPAYKSYQSRLGLARVYVRMVGTPEARKYDKIIEIYQSAISLYHSDHDVYIELGEILEKHSSSAEAIDLYSKFPFTEPPSQDDLYLHGEIIRLLVKSKQYSDVRLLKSMIAQGRVNGMKSLSATVELLDSASESKQLMALYASVNQKPMDDVQYFKSEGLGSVLQVKILDLAWGREYIAAV